MLDNYVAILKMILCKLCDAVCKLVVVVYIGTDSRLCKVYIGADSKSACATLIVQAIVCNVCDGVVVIQALTKENNSETTTLAPQTVKQTIEANEVATQGMAFY